MLGTTFLVEGLVDQTPPSRPECGHATGSIALISRNNQSPSHGAFDASSRAAPTRGTAVVRHGPPPNERTEFFQIWHQVSAGLAVAAAGLDRLPEPRRGLLLEIVQDLQAQQSRLFAEVEQLPPTSVAAITYVQRATGELYALAERVKSLAVHIQPERVAPPPIERPMLGGPQHHGANRFDSTLDKLHVALHAAGGPGHALVPAHGYAPPHASHAAHGAPCTVCQQPVQIVYLQPQMAPPPPDYGALPRIATHYHRPYRDEDDAPPQRRRDREERRSGDETPAAMVSTLLKGMGGISVLIASAVMVSNFSFADLFGGSRPSLPPPVAVEQPIDRPGIVASPVLAPGDKAFHARLDVAPRRDVIEGSRGHLAAAPPETRPTASVAPIARSKPEARRVGELTAADLELKPQRPQVRVISKAAIVESEQEAEPVVAETPLAPKKVAMLVPPSPAPSARPVEKPEPQGKAEPEGGGLYVAVLSTHKDAKAAREEFSELQKKHRDVLGAKQSEVQMAAGATGAWHRLVVTPAVPRDAANDLCTRLRTAGYGKCWVKPY